jgi:triosephosphate isomerase
MSIPEDAPQPEYETTFILEKDGKRKEFTEDNYPYEDSTWVFIESKTKVIQEGYQPPLQDFVLQHPEQGNITDQLINQSEPLFLVIAPSLQDIDEKQKMKLAEFQQSSRQDGLDFYIVTASTSGQITRFNDQSPTEFDFLLGDETNLKTIIRSNPGMLLIINGTIAGKWHYNDLPPVEAAGQPLSFALTQQQNHKTFLLLMAHAFVIALAAFLILFQFRKTQNNKKQ